MREKILRRPRPEVGSALTGGCAAQNPEHSAVDGGVIVARMHVEARDARIVDPAKRVALQNAASIAESCR